MLIRDKEDEKIFAGNGMLNKPGFQSTSAYAHRINVPTYEINADDTFISPGYSDSQFFISTCGSDHVTIEGDIDSEEGMDNSLYKIDTLIAGLLEFRKDLIEARKIMIEREKIAKALRKAKDEKDKSRDNS